MALPWGATQRPRKIRRCRVVILSDRASPTLPSLVGPELEGTARFTNPMLPSVARKDLRVDDPVSADIRLQKAPHSCRLPLMCSPAAKIGQCCVIGAAPKPSISLPYVRQLEHSYTTQCYFLNHRSYSLVGLSLKPGTKFPSSPCSTVRSPSQPLPPSVSLPSS